QPARARPQAARSRGADAAERRRVRAALLRAAEDRRDPDRRARHTPLRRDQPVRAALRRHDVRLSRAAGRLRVRADDPARTLRYCISLSQLEELIERPATLPKTRLGGVHIEPTDPCIFQLSGGTTGIPKLIPRTHNDYAYNSKTAAPVCGVTADSVLLLALPIAHNLPLACPGVQGYFFQGGMVVLSPTTRPEPIFELIQKHAVTHIKVVPALLIRLISDPSFGKYDFSSLKLIQSGGQRMQPEVRLRTQELIPSAFVQENFGMSEGMLFFVRLDDPQEVKLETCG